jgi:hypothetical protein
VYLFVDHVKVLPLAINGVTLIAIMIDMICILGNEKGTVKCHCYYDEEYGGDHDCGDWR